MEINVFRVKELREQAEMAERAAELREAEQRARADSLQAKMQEQVLSLTHESPLRTRLRTLSGCIQMSFVDVNKYLNHVLIAAKEIQVYTLLK